jgi:ABC-2 type transport system permease protein
LNTLWWRLILVELRKMVDTRAGAWLLGVIGLSTAAIVTVVVIFVESAEQTFGTFFVMAVLPVAFLLPVLGVLLVTTEWSQRTALTTFALVPVRHRVLAAKLIAAVVASVASVVTSLAAAAAGTAIAVAAGTGASTGRWRIEAALIGYAVLFQVINVVMGVAFGMLLLNTPVAIVLLLLLPTVWTVLGGLIEQLRGIAQWLDLTLTTEPLLTPDVTAGQWARLATSVAVWVLVPLIAGMLRIQRRDIA